jgi:hypothetical protein
VNISPPGCTTSPPETWRRETIRERRADLRVGQLLLLQRQARLRVGEL